MVRGGEEVGVAARILGMTVQRPSVSSVMASDDNRQQKTDHPSASEGRSVDVTMSSWRCTVNAPHSMKCTLFGAFSEIFKFHKLWKYNDLRNFDSSIYFAHHDIERAGD